MYLSAGETYWFDYCSTVTDIAQINCNHELFTTKTQHWKFKQCTFYTFFLIFINYMITFQLFALVQSKPGCVYKLIRV